MVINEGGWDGLDRLHAYLNSKCLQNFSGETLTHIEDLAYFAYLVEQEMHAKF